MRPVFPPASRTVWPRLAPFLALLTAVLCAVPAAWAQGPRPAPSFAAPGLPPHYDRIRDYDVIHTVLRVRFDWERRAVSGTVVHRLTPFRDGLTVLDFDQHRMRFDRMRLLDGPDLQWRAAGDTLAVELDRAYSRGETLSVAITYEAVNPPEGLYFNEPDKDYPDRPRQVWTQGEQDENHFWFPCYDALNDRMTTEEYVTADDGYTVIGNGILAGTRKNGDGTSEWHYRQDVPAPTYLISLVVGKYEAYESEWDGIQVLSYVRPSLRAQAPLAFGRTAEMIRLFSERTGVRYPYPVYRQTEVADFLFGGMENITATTLTARTLHPESVAPAYDSDDLVSHELAHQWWGDYCTTGNWSNLWLNEGFAAYFESLWWEFSGDSLRAQWTRIHDLDEYLRSDRGGRRPLVTRYYDTSEDLFDAVSYEKGALVLHMIRERVGDAAFWKGLRIYADRHGASDVESGDLREAMAAAGGIALDRFFDQWVFHGGHPEFRASWDWDGRSKLVHLVLSQTQKTDDLTPLFAIDVDVDLTGEGWHRRVVVRSERERGDFYLPAPSRPELVELDRDGKLIKTLTFDKSTGEYVRQLRSPALPSRVAAARALGERRDESAVPALAAALADTAGFWGLRGEAAGALGRIGGDAARDALLAGLDRAPARARGDVAETLGNFHEKRVVERLRSAALGDPIPQVSEGAVKGLGALGRAGVDGAYDALVAASGRDSWNDTVRNAAVGAFRTDKDVRALDTVERYTRPGVAMRTRESALRTLGVLGAELEPKDPREKAAREILTAALADPFLRIRESAVAGLKSLGDPAAADALDRAAAADDDRGMRSAAAEASESVRGGGEKSTVAGIRKDLDRLRESNASLKDEIRRLESRIQNGEGSAPAEHKDRTDR